MPEHSRPRPAGRRRKPAARIGVEAAASLCEPGLDAATIERMLLALAVHPAGAGFQRAHLLLWNPDRRSFESHGTQAASATPQTLDRALRSARRPARLGRGAANITLEPADLDEGLRRAWLACRCGRFERGAHPRMPWIKGHESGAVALRAGHQPFGLLIGEWDEDGHGPERNVALEGLRKTGNAALSAFALAENVRRLEARARALAEFARATVTAHNVAELGDVVVRLACEGAGARGAAVWRQTPERIDLLSCYGPAGTRDRIGRGLFRLAQKCAQDSRATLIEPAGSADGLPLEVAAQVSSAAMIPLVAFGRAHGALAVYDRLPHQPGDGMGFEADDVRFLHALADLAAMALAQTESEAGRKKTEQARRDLLQYLDRRERLADLGEMAVRMAHEARNPLASIGAFARRVHKGLPEDDPQREYLEVVIREAERLERSITVPLERVSLKPPRLRIESVNTLIQAALEGLSEQMVRRRVRLLKKLTPDLPGLLLDVERFGHVFANVLADALDRVSAGGRIRVESRRTQQFVVVEIANDGRTEPGGALEDLFVPFHLRGGARAEAGLAMARQVVEQQGGEVRVRTEGEWSTVYVLTLPVRENQDRRNSTDRRVVRADRRERAPAR